MQTSDCESKKCREREERSERKFAAQEWMMHQWLFELDVSHLSLSVATLWKSFDQSNRHVINLCGWNRLYPGFFGCCFCSFISLNNKKWKKKYNNNEIINARNRALWSEIWCFLNWRGPCRGPLKGENRNKPNAKKIDLKYFAVTIEWVNFL